jgi:polyferredoxin
MNNLFVGPVFELETRYTEVGEVPYLNRTHVLGFTCAPGSQILVTMLVTMMYGTGIPILFLFAAVGFFVRYWMEKVRSLVCLFARPALAGLVSRPPDGQAMLLKYNQKPPRYGPQLAKMALSILPWALFLHLTFSVWMVSSPGLLPAKVIGSGA